jgi:cysteine-rich repeat protein
MRTAPSHHRLARIVAALLVTGAPLLTTTASVRAQTCTFCCQSLCGDGVLDPGEECDDGYQYSSGGCCGPACKLTARCTLAAALASPACTGQTIPAGVAGRISTAEHLIDQATTSSAKKARRLRNKARRALKQAGTKANRTATRKYPTLSVACAAALKGAADHVLAGL